VDRRFLEVAVNNVPFFGIFVPVLFDRIYRIARIHFYSLFPEETRNTKSPSALIYDVLLTVRYLCFTSTPADSKLTKRVSSVTHGS